MKHFCNYCKTLCIKKGVRNGIQKYVCPDCGRYQQSKYTYKLYDVKQDEEIIRYSKEGCGISSIARLTGLSKSMVQLRLTEISNLLKKPVYKERNQEYELDGMSVKVAGEKDIYLIYAINRRTRKIIDFVIGKRTKENIKKVIDSIMHYYPKRIFTDGLNSYPSLIAKNIHKPGRRLTNRIERKNLTLRNMIKRLSKGTLAFSRTTEMLTRVVKICAWL